MGWESVVKTVNEKKATHTGSEKKQVNKSGWEGIVHTVNSRPQYTLTDIHGKQYGPVSYSAVKAIRETTPANRKIYKYTPVNEQEKNILDSYLKVMSPVLDASDNTTKSNAVDGKSNGQKAGFGEWLGKNAWAGLGQFNKGLFATLDFLLPTEFLGRYDFISNLNNYYHNASDKATEEAQKSSTSRGKGWKTAGDLVSGTTAALPNAILAAMTAGTSLGGSALGAGIEAVSTSSSAAAILGNTVRTMTKNPMYWTSFMQTVGTDYEEAKERGASDFVAGSTAILTSALNAGIEIGGGIEQLPKNLKNGGKRTILNWVESMVDEGKEEVLQGITTNAMAKLMYDPKAPILSITDEKAIINPVKGVKEFAAGAAVGGILGAGQIGAVKAVNSAQISRTGKFFNKPEIRQAVIDTGLESPKDTEAYKLANKINAKKGKVSDFELGKLYLANVEQINSENQMQDDVQERITTAPKTEQFFVGNTADLHNKTQLMSDRQNYAMKKDAAKKILSAAISSQRGKNISLEQAEDAIQSVTNRSKLRIQNVISPDGNVKIDEAKILDANFEFLSSPEQLIDIQYFRKYADTFAESLQARGSSEFQNMMKYTDDAAGDIANYALKQFVPSGYSPQAARALEIYGNGYKEILQDAGNSAYIAKLRLYKEAPLMSAQISALKEGDLNRVFSIAKDQWQGEEIYQQYKNGNTVRLSDGTPVIQGEQGEVYAFGENAFRLANMTGIEPVSMLIGEELVPMLRAERSEIPAQVQERTQQESNVNHTHGDRYYKNPDNRKENKIAKTDTDGIMGVNEVHSAQQVNNGTEDVLNQEIKTQRMEENHGEIYIPQAESERHIYRGGDRRTDGAFETANDNNQQSDAPRGGESHRAAETGISGEIQKQLSKTLYHGTNADIKSFVPSYVDLGIHFGTREQAQNRISDAEHPKFVAAKLNIKNPLYVREDIFGERSPQEYLDGLMEFADLTGDEKKQIVLYTKNIDENEISRLAQKSLQEKMRSQQYILSWSAEDDGIYTTLSLMDESGQEHPIPRMEMISYTDAMQVLDAEDTIALIRRQKISAQGEEQLRRLAVDKLTNIEADYLRLRNLEKAIQSLGYDGFVYPNDNEGKGLSFAVFDNEQIEKFEINSSVEGVSEEKTVDNPKKNDIIDKEDNGAEVVYYDFGVQLYGKPAKSDIHRIAQMAEADGIVIELHGTSENAPVLVYDAGVPTGTVENDIVQYYEQGIIPEDAIVDDLPFGEEVNFSLSYDEDGKPAYVVVEEDIFTGHEGEKPHKVIRDYLRQHIGEFATLIESGQKVYIGRDLPGEYTQSRYTRTTTPYIKNAKNQAAQNIGELIEIGTNRQWRKTHKIKHENDASYGWYKYATRFKVGDDLYSADLLIRNADDGKKYLYDIINIKKETPAQRGEKSPYLRTAKEGRTDISGTSGFDDKTISQKDNSVNSYSMQTSENDANSKGEKEHEKRGNLSINGNLGRTSGARAGEQAGSLAEGAGRAKTFGGGGEESNRARRVYAKDVKAAGRLSTQVIHAGRRSLKIDRFESADYNREMHDIAEKNSENGIRTVFYSGGGAIAFSGGKKARGFIVGDTIYIQYDNTKYSPAQINRHEMTHRRYRTQAVQRIKNVVANSFTLSERREIANRLYRDYMEITEGREEAVLEEFVCDIMAGMNEYAEQFSDIVEEYWYADADIAGAEHPEIYAQKTDSGGRRKTNGRGDDGQTAEGVSDESGNQRRGSRGNHRDLPLRLSESEIGATGQMENRRTRNGSKRSGKDDLVELPRRTKETYAQGGRGTASERFRQAVESGDTETAKTLISQQAEENGFVPATVYHSTFSDTVFTQFEGDAAHWVSTEYGYSKYYGSEIALDKDAETRKKSEQLHTAPGSGIYELFIKPGKVLDVGNINEGINGLEDLEKFADQVGFSMREIMDCWNQSRKYESRRKWTITATSAFADYARARGYDSLRALEGEDGNVETFGILYPENIKSAKTAVYDESGNLIPLHQRFDTSNPDIRYSMQDSNEQIRDDIETVRLRAEMRDGKVYTKRDAEQVVQSILDNLDVGTGRGFAVKNKDKQVMTILANRILNADTNAKMQKQINSLSSYLVQHALVTEEMDYFDYAGALQTVREMVTHKVRLSEEEKYVIDAMLGKDRSAGYKALLGGGDQGIDVIYDNIASVRPDLFPPDIYTSSAKMRKTLEVYQFLKEGIQHKSQLLSEILKEEDREQLSGLISEQIFLAMESGGRDSRLRTELQKAEAKYQNEISRLREKYENEIIALRKKSKDAAKKKFDKMHLVPLEPAYLRPENLTAAAERFGRIQPGENPVRDIAVPKKISPKDYVSRFARTMLEAGATPDYAVSEFEKRILDGTMTYERITDEASKKQAERKIKQDGFADALSYWTHQIESEKRLNKFDMALGMTLYNQCVNAKDVTNAMKIAADLANEATRSGQNVQALRLLKQMSADGTLYTLERSVAHMNHDFEKLLGKKFQGIVLSEEKMQRYLEAKTDKEKSTALDDLQMDIARQIPSTLKDKWDAWRYLEMLGNPRTHIRNIVGNAVFVPVIEVKNVIGAILEKKISKGERTKSIWRTKESLDFAIQDFKKVESAVRGDVGRYEIMNGIDEKRNIFKPKWLEKVRKWNLTLLENEDAFFLRRAYVSSFSRAMTARNLSADFLNSGTFEANTELEKLRDYATSEAQKATYRDANALAESLNRLQNSAKRSQYKAVRASGLLLEGLVPFKKTPLNILRRGVEYSPIGLLNGIYKICNGTKSGKWSISAAIDDVAKGMTGTMLMLLGMFLANLGVIKGKGEKYGSKQGKFYQMIGEQDYALNFSGNSFTIDWMAPSSLPLFVGVELFGLMENDGLAFADVANALTKISEPMFELSVLQGINDAFTAAGYNDENPLYAVVESMALSYVTQAVPTLGGQFARTIDKTQRITYVNKNSQLPESLSKFIQKVEKKIPFASYALQPAVDNWGRIETYEDNPIARVLENFVSPGYYEEENLTRVDKELKRLYEKTGDSSVLPTTPQKYLTDAGQRIDLTGSQYTEYAQIRGKKAYDLVSEVTSSNKYKKLSDDEKVKEIKKLHDEARDYAKEKMNEKYDFWPKKSKKKK